MKRGERKGTKRTASRNLPEANEPDGESVAGGRPGHIGAAGLRAVMETGVVLIADGHFEMEGSAQPGEHRRNLQQNRRVMYRFVNATHAAMESRRGANAPGKPRGRPRDDCTFGNPSKTGHFLQVTRIQMV